MTNNLPDYKNLGFSETMGQKLREEVERQLIDDLRNYGIEKTNLRFDWSESCIEGKTANFLDGTVENFSGISVYDNQNSLVADGWMEFILENETFIVYWEFVTVWGDKNKLKEKTNAGIPSHIWTKIPNELRTLYQTKRM